MLFLKKSFYFLRHGETDWNTEQRIMGQTDIPLNNQGILQAQTVAEKIATLPVDLIIVSPLKRAKITAEIVNNTIHRPIIIEDNIQERCWGIMEGKKKGDCSYNGIPFEPEKWVHEGIVPSGAESFSQFSDRVTTAVTQHLTTHQNILFVSHGGVIMALLKAVDRLPSQNIKNTGLYHFIVPEPGQTTWNIDILND